MRSAPRRALSQGAGVNRARHPHPPPTARSGPRAHHPDRVLDDDDRQAAAAAGETDEQLLATVEKAVREMGADLLDVRKKHQALVERVKASPHAERSGHDPEKCLRCCAERGDFDLTGVPQ